MSSDRIWMPHAGHFIGGSYCQFKLCTYVNGYIVSTIGELKWPHRDECDADYYRRTFEALPWIKPLHLGLPEGVDTLGADPKSFYETMVFKARKSKELCCPYEMETGSSVDSTRYATADEATRGHMDMLMTWERPQ